MANKRNFVITKKYLAKYLNISRPTLDKKLSESGINYKNMWELIPWMQFEGTTWAKTQNDFNNYVYMRRGERCEICGSTHNLQIHHIEKRKKRPEMTFVYKNVKVVCSDCHNNIEDFDRDINGRPLGVISNFLSRNKDDNCLGDSVNRQDDPLL